MDEKILFVFDFSTILEFQTKCERVAKRLGTTKELFRRRDEWRKHPRLSNQLCHALPSLGLGVAAFGVYLVGKQVYNKLLAPCSSSSSSHHSSHSSASH
nr:NADH dehydrogenase [ubiquinone] 1 beta subcomplex subunit 3-B-like [Ziziphus jujuba var. spinosa]XP_048336960.1 NADH dehydrogenase [ubiquinone] 1 beta subcomplex subunit 3-B-like [Ziziphus jujuba var. spinosa]